MTAVLAFSLCAS
uniref:UORF n=1 Tax=Apis mellifera TaxID=7460 RepID=Q8T0Y6_APIME|nr:uORF [Apis mellifera]